MTIKRVLQVGKFYPPMWGGIETVTVGMEELRDNTLTVDTMVFGMDANEINSKHGTTTVFPFKEFKGVPFSFRLLRAIVRNADRYDAVFVHYPNVMPIIALLFLKKKSVYLYWHAEAGNKGFIFTNLFNILLFFIRSKIKTIIAPTFSHYKTLPKFLKNKNQAILMYYPTDVLRIASNQSVKTLSERIDVPRPYFIVVGRLVPYKGISFVISAFRIFLEASPKHVKLVIIGSGPLERALREQISKLDLDCHVELITHATHENKIQFLSGAVATIFTSITNQEMFGLTQVESYALGVPTITTEIPNSGVSDIARASSASIIVDRHDTAQLVDAMQTLINDVELNGTLSRSGIAYFEKTFRKSKIREDLKHLME